MELLIVIALISILAVAVLATINPIEQTNKARDARVQNDAAEVMNSYERYYANKQEYPWMQFADATPVSVDDVMVLRSDQVGFGICYGDEAVATSATTGACNTTGSNLGTLIDSDELKAAFVGKGEFQDVGTDAEEGLWLYKRAGSGGSIYVCYIPKAKSNRDKDDKLYCIEDLSGSESLVKADDSAVDTCVALATSDSGWDTPALDATSGMFMCVPE